MLVIKSQKNNFKNWIINSSINESEKKHFLNWILNSPIDIYIPRIPPGACSLSAGWCKGYDEGYVIDIIVDVDWFDWMSYITKEYSYISIDSEVIKYLNWIGDIPTSNFTIDKRTGYYQRKDNENLFLTKKIYKKVSVCFIKLETQFYFNEDEEKAIGNLFN